MATTSLRDTVRSKVFGYITSGSRGWIPNILMRKFEPPFVQRMRSHERSLWIQVQQRAHEWLLHLAQQAWDLVPQGEEFNDQLLIQRIREMCPKFTESAAKQLIDAYEQMQVVAEAE